MPVEKPMARRAFRIAVLGFCLMLESILIWYNYEGDGKLRHGGLLTILLLIMLFALTSTGILPIPQGANIPFFGVWPRLADSFKAAASFLLIFVWTPIAVQLTPDTPIGVAIILVPDAAFAVAALLYLSNSLSGRTQ
jgi:hypothetical protein